MRRDFTIRKRIILGVLAALILADVGLAAYSLHLASAPEPSEQRIKQQRDELKTIRAIIKRAQEIRGDMPKTQKDCEKFEKSLLPGNSGYSALSAELGNIAKESGARLDDISFKPTTIAERGVVELVIDSTIAGEYKNVIQFLNRVQRSSNHYSVESLTLAPEAQSQGGVNAIRVGLHIKTYFRTGA